MIKLHVGDSFEMIKDVKSKSVSLVQTDVPYPDMIIHDDNTSIVNSQEWIEWFSPLAKEIKRVLKDGGSLVTTINSKYDFSFYHKWVSWMCDELGLTYVYNWYWMKTRVIPGGSYPRPRDATDFIAHFYKGSIDDSKDVYDMDAIDDWTRYNPSTKVPTNLIYASSSDQAYREACKELGMKHNGKYPGVIPELFIKLLTKKGDIILDPFNGSGTTSIVASELGRKCIAFEYNKKWVRLAKRQYDNANLRYKVVVK